MAGDPAAAPAPARACRSCQASMAPEQDWCLTCGAAAPGRLGGRPGWRSAGSVAALTLVLVTGAVAASYAALSGDASTKAGQTAPASIAPVPGAVAQVPDAPAPPAPPATTPPAATVEPPTPKPTPAPATPVIPTPTPTPMPTPEPTTPTDESDTPTDEDEDESTTTGEDEPATPAPTLTKLELGADAMALYDPAKRNTRVGDPADAYDGDKTTAWFVSTPDDEFPMQVGLLVDLESPKTVKQLNLGITTPGGRVEVYGASGSALPPDILDTRWESIASRSKLDQTDTAGNERGDKQEQIRLRSGGGKFRYVLLWFTTAPTASKTVRVSELDLLG